MALTSSRDQPIWQRGMVACAAVLVGLFLVSIAGSASLDTLRYINQEYLRIWTPQSWTDQPDMLVNAVTASCVSLFGTLLIVLGVRDLLQCRKRSAE
jgi:hypothetical protein